MKLSSSPSQLSGMEQGKARDEEGKEGEADVAMAETSSKDPIIIRKVSAVSLGQAISVVGSYKAEATEEIPQAKKLPEPILPSTQPKYKLKHKGCNL